MAKKSSKKSSMSVSFPQDRLFVGIDPGASGGIAFFHRSRSWTWHPMPGSDLELREIADSIEQISSEIGVEPYVTIELVHSMPGQGVASMFKFGMGYGAVRQAFCKMPTEFVHPRTWQKAMGVSSRAKDESKPQYKDRLRQKAIRLFPKLSVWTKGLGVQRSVCDAILIAEYGKRKMQGLL